MAVESSNQLSSVTIRDDEVTEYTWNFTVPPRSKIQRNIEIVKMGGFHFSGLVFDSGFLTDIKHKWGITFFSNQINAHMYLPIRDRTHIYRIIKSYLHFYSDGELQGTQSLPFSKDLHSAAPDLLWVSCWRNQSAVWDDTIDQIKICFRICREFSGECATTVAPPPPISEIQYCKELNASEFYLNEHLSDIKIICKGKAFPGHRFLLSCRSPALDKKLRTESTGDLVPFEDMEVNVLKLFLEFLYCGKVTPQANTEENLYIQLLHSAVKYQLPGLRVLCELEIVGKIKLENCLEMYSMAKECKAELLKERSWNLIMSNKRKLFGNRDDFRQLAIECPDLIFELFQSLE